MDNPSNDLSNLLREQRRVFQDSDILQMSDAERFALSIRLQFPKFSKGFSVDDFTSFINSNIGVENLVTLGKLSFPNEWQMELKSKKIREKLIRMGRTKINTRTCWISPLSRNEVRGYVHWIPNAVGKNAIENVLNQYGEVLFIETLKLEKFERVDSDSRYFALILKVGKTVDDMPHITRIDGHTGLITIRGRRPMCFHCHEVGHRKSDCKQHKLKLTEYCQRKPTTDHKRIRPRGTRHMPSVSQGNASEVSKGKKRRKKKTKLQQGQPQNLVASSEKSNQVSVSEGAKTVDQKKSNSKIVGGNASSQQQSETAQPSATGDTLEFIKTIDKLKTLIANFENVGLSNSISNAATQDPNVNATVQENASVRENETVQENETGTKKKKKKKNKKKKDAVANSEVA